MKKERNQQRTLDNVLLELADTISKTWEKNHEDRMDIARFLYATSTASSAYLLITFLEPISPIVGLFSVIRLINEDSRPTKNDKNKFKKELYPSLFLTGSIVTSMGIMSAIEYINYKELILRSFHMAMIGVSIVCYLGAEYISRTKEVEAN